MHFDYTTVGHVTADVMGDGSRRVGGSAFYSALQAARLGLRAQVITSGVAGEIEELLEPYRAELELEILPAAQTTTLETVGAGAARAQRMLGWAGPIEADVAIDTAILHLAPVARETSARWRGNAEFVGITPQGLVRSWDQEHGEISHVPLAPALLPERYDAIVISETERDDCARLIADSGEAGPRGAVLVVTAAAAPTAIHLPADGVTHVEVPAIADFRDDIGAGDVFAAAFFVALQEGRTVQDGARFANAAAAVRIAVDGAGAIGNREAIEERLRAVA